MMNEIAPSLSMTSQGSQASQTIDLKGIGKGQGVGAKEVHKYHAHSLHTFLDFHILQLESIKHYWLGRNIEGRLS